MIECVGVGEGLMREMMRLEVTQDGFDVVQFRRVFWQPLDREPVSAGGDRRQGELAGVDRAIILDQDHRLDGLAGLGAIEAVQLFKMSDEIAAALGWACVHNELACDVIERSEHGDLLRLSRRGDAQVRPCLCPNAGKVGMRQRLAFVTIEQDDIVGCGLLLAQPQTKADPFDLGRTLPPLQRVPRTPPAELFYAVPWRVVSG